MSGSVLRPAASVWHASRDALDLAGDICDAASEIKGAGEVLMAYPADGEQRMAARSAAREVIALCDRLEGISGPMGRQ